MTGPARAMDPRWAQVALLIIEALLEGPQRFTQVERALGDASPKVIAVRLREL
jgi:DNA-binding HxlR family transcriptional regulator